MRIRHFRPARRDDELYFQIVPDGGRAETPPSGRTGAPTPDAPALLAARGVAAAAPEP